MRNKYLIFGLLVIAFVLIIIPIALAANGIVYVTKDKVKLKEGPDESIYKTVGEVKYRDILEILETKGDWYKVKDMKSGGTGWIYKGKVSKDKPPAKKSSGSALGKSARGGAGSETTETAASAGIKPFSSGNYQGLQGDFNAVHGMELLRENIKDKEVIDFLYEGKLK